MGDFNNIARSFDKRTKKLLIWVVLGNLTMAVGIIAAVEFAARWVIRTL